jgi:hypothetical protein
MLMVFCAGIAHADPGIDAVKALGRLNGEALACKQMALVDRIRIAIVYEASKTREIGEIFEQATSERFLAMGADKSSCPDGRNLAQQVESAIAVLSAAYRKPAQ